VPRALSGVRLSSKLVQDGVLHSAGGPGRPSDCGGPMTLRFRLLLVYAMVVLLSVATVAIAVYELGRAHQLMRELQDWNAIVLNVQQLKAAPPDRADLSQLVARQYLFLLEYFRHPPDYLDVDRVRRALNAIEQQHRQWQNLAPEERPRRTGAVAQALDQLSAVLQEELDKLNAEADKQGVRIQILLATVIALTVLHVLLIGSLLRRWLLHPMQRLGLQVQALARDEPPPQPMVDAPPEMARLAEALESARRSLGTLRARLIESERLTTIGQLAAQLAHNLRNPLGSIRATAQLIARRQENKSELRQRMEEIITSVDRLDRWIAGLMEVARAEPTPTTAADVRPTLHRVGEALHPELEKKELTLAVQIPDTPLVCRHDPATLEHALVAMIVNAVEASPLGERITMSAERVTDTAAQEDKPVPQATSPAWCRITVRDRGKGLPADTPERIFDFSYSTKQQGMGLGLALAKQALQRQGGRVGAYNNPDGGATVYVEFPAEDSPVPT